MSLGNANLQTSQRVVPQAPPGPPFDLDSAENGLSVDPVDFRIVLGQRFGEPGDPAVLLHDTEIPMNTRRLRFFDNFFGSAFEIFGNFISGVFTNAGGYAAANGLGANIGFQAGPGTTSFISSQALEIAIFGSTGVSINNNSSPGDPGANNLNVDFDRVGLGVLTPTARLHLAAGGGGAQQAPFKYTAGAASQATLPAGAKNFNGTNEFLTAGGVNYTMAKTLTATAALDFPNTNAQTSSDLTIALAGAADGDVVVLGVPIAALNADSCYTAFVSAAGVVTVRFNNYSAAAINPASGTFRVAVVKY